MKKKSLLSNSFKCAALYIRVSTGKQEELSPDAQKRLLIDYAKKNGIIVTDEYIFMENGISGKNATNRPEFQRMISIAKSKPKPFDVILVWKFSRFARNQDESVFYKSILRKKCGIDVVSITEPISEGMYGRLIEMIIEWNDEFYSYNLSQEVARGMEEKALRGGYQSTPCLGYAAVGEGKPHVIVEDEFKIYQYIADLYDFDNLDATAIARKVNELGYRTKRGNPFEARTVNRLLKNKFYAGIVSWNGIEFDGTHEVRISKERFEKRMERMESSYKPKMRHDVSSCKHWLSGIVKCPICGCSLGYNRSNTPFFQCWKYAKGFHPESISITERKLVRSVLNNFEEILDGKDFSFQYIPPSPPKNDEISLLEIELENLKRRESRIRLAFESEIDTLDEYKANKARIQAERERILSEIDKRKAPDSSAPTKEEMLSKIQRVYNIISDPDVDYQSKGIFIRSILEDIVYDKQNDRLLFHFYYS